MNSLEEFIDYVWSFYGEHDDTLYPIHGLTKKDIKDAIYEYWKQIEKYPTVYTWGYGDSLDRERVRDIILEQPQFIGWSFN
tara:strand:- start:636 stop:878 length:243 start_codon:yes stop_codon:yes gene_type:complete